jgi:hypothetical protein
MLSASADTRDLHERIRDLEKCLHQRDDDFALVFDLPPKMGDLLGLLYTMPVVTPEVITQRLAIATDAKAAVYRLRKLVEKHNIEIVGRRGYGYFLRDSSRELICSKLRGSTGVAVVDGQPERTDEL